jgi:DNA repair protein RadC
MTIELIADLPLEERPRERLARHGAETLSDSELVAILLGSGVRGRSALQVARELLGDGLVGLSRRESGGGPAVAGVGAAKWARIVAALEIGRRIAAHADDPSEPIRDATSIARRLIARYSHHVQERLGAVYLDAKHRIIREREIYVGTLNSAAVSARDVLRFALEDHAASMIVFHNHPSGDPAPSAEDILFTRKLVDAGKLLGVDVVDHLVIGRNRFVSLKDRGVM